MVAPTFRNSEVQMIYLSTVLKKNTR